MTPTKLIAKFVVLVFFSLGAFPGTTESEPLWIEKNSSPVGDETVISNSLFTRLTETAGPAVVNIRIMMKITPSYRDYPGVFRPADPVNNPDKATISNAARVRDSSFIPTATSSPTPTSPCNRINYRWRWKTANCTGDGFSARTK
jgi:hypothetical protein